MKVIKNFDIREVPVTQLIFAATSEPDYSMSRVLVYEDYPDEGDFCVATGEHCSCYGFDEVQWDAIAYTNKELVRLMEAWHAAEDEDYEIEPRIAPLIFDYVRMTIYPNRPEPMRKKRPTGLILNGEMQYE